MGMIPCETKPEEIAKIINGKDFNDFHLRVRQGLGIQDLHYSIEIEDYRKIQDGFGDEY